MYGSRSRSPAECGAADAYYGGHFGYNPHFYKDGVIISFDKMSKEELAEYKAGFESEDGRKDW